MDLKMMNRANKTPSGNLINIGGNTTNHPLDGSNMLLNFDRLDLPSEIT